MRNMDIAGTADQKVSRDSAESADEFTPAEFFKDAGRVIAVCLGLGLLMQLLLG